MPDNDGTMQDKAASAVVAAGSFAVLATFAPFSFWASVGLAAMSGGLTMLAAPAFRAPNMPAGMPMLGLGAGLLKTTLPEPDPEEAPAVVTKPHPPTRSGRGGKPVESATRPAKETRAPAPSDPRPTPRPATKAKKAVPKPAEVAPEPVKAVEPVPAPEPVVTPEPAPAPEPVMAPVVEVAATPDDLKRIKGIGPKLEGQLNAMGITRFDQIAAWSEADVARFDGELKAIGRIARDDWVGQAKAFLALGGEG